MVAVCSKLTVVRLFLTLVVMCILCVCGRSTLHCVYIHTLCIYIRYYMRDGIHIPVYIYTTYTNRIFLL